MFFKVELPPDASVTFIEEDKVNETDHYHLEYIRLNRRILRDGSIASNMLQEFFYGRNGYHFLIKNLNILEYIYTLNYTPRGCFANLITDCNDKISTPILYSDPFPTTKFNGLTFPYIKNHGAPGATRLRTDLYNLKHIHNYLNIGGYALFYVNGNSTDGSLALPYLLTSFFKFVIVSINGNCIGVGYNGSHLKEEGVPYLPTEITNDYKIFRINMYKESINLYSLMLHNRELGIKHLTANRIDIRIRLAEPLTETYYSIYLNFLKMFQSDPSNIIGLNMKDGSYLYNIILKLKAKHVLELGLKNGMFTIYLLMAAYLNDGHITTIDPDETSSGIHLIREMRLKTWHTWINAPYHKSLKRQFGNIYDIVFINAWYENCYVEADVYLVDVVLRVGGILIIDNFFYKGDHTSWISMLKEMKKYKQIINSSKFIIFKKVL